MDFLASASRSSLNQVCIARRVGKIHQNYHVLRKTRYSSSLRLQAHQYKHQYRHQYRHQLQTRGDPLAQFIARLCPFLGTSISEEGRIVRLVISNDIGSVGEDSLNNVSNDHHTIP